MRVDESVRLSYLLLPIEVGRLAKVLKTYYMDTIKGVYALDSMDTL